MDIVSIIMDIMSIIVGTSIVIIFGLGFIALVIVFREIRNR